jgi:hypothetical protein
MFDHRSATPLELVKTQRVLNAKHLGLAAIRQTGGTIARLLLRSQTNFLRTVWKFNSVFNPALQMADHARPVAYELPAALASAASDRRALYVHKPAGRRGRAGRCD